MILVWSTRLRPAPIAIVRANWRTRTTSSEERISSRSLFVVIFQIRRLEPRVDERHAAFDVQSGLDPRQGQSKLDQRDRDRRTHADNDRVGIQNAGHRGDIVEHPADEAVHDLQRRDVDENTLGPEFHDFAGQVLFERGRETVVHVDLNGHKQRIPEFQDWNAVHDHWPFSAGVMFWSATAAAFLILVTARPVLSSATASASASDAFETTVNSTPRWTMVWAICGRMPLMMQSAPMSRAAATVLRRCCAVS